MDKSKMLTIGVAIISFIGAFLFIRVIMADGSDSIDGAVGAIVTFSKLLLIAAAAIAIIFSVVNLIKHPQALKKTMIGLAALGVLLAIAYFMASGDAVTDGVGNVLKDGAAGATSKWVSALINFTGFLGVIGLVVIALGFVRSFK
jgi:hypothetical protein